VPRPKNRVESVQVTFNTTPIVVQYLQDLVDAGLHGHNQADAAERLVTSAIEALVQSGTLRRKPPYRPKR
jgi:hypothetical protein